MKTILCYPAVESQSELVDLVARLSWHFAHIDVTVHVSLAAGVQKPDRFIVPDYMDADIGKYVGPFLSRIVFESDEGFDPATGAEGYDAILKIRQIGKDPLKVPAGIKAYRVDPNAVRQEGSFYIQAALDLCNDTETHLAQSVEKFAELKKNLGHFSRAWTVATGPSVGNFMKYDYSEDLVIGCNSVILNDELVQKTGMKLLVFADPIFHFGVSQYAGAFRAALVEKLQQYDINILIPFKYYPLMVSRCPEIANRIIGVPFDPHVPFNFDMGEKFVVRTTANVLTLMLLPIAASFADEIVTIGCDGRPVDEDSYFWGHDKTVQINDKMDNIRQVHPGFFKIDYNDYYFEHCHTLQNMIEDGEAQGKKFWHAGQSHIPALKKRQLGQVTARPVKDGGDELVLIAEPDGIGSSGHYVPWHNNLCEELQKRYAQIEVLCNKKQDVSLYHVHATPTFGSHSWGISRGDKSMWRSFADQSNFKNYCKDFLAGILAAVARHKNKNIKIFAYYGSVQVLHAIQHIEADLRKEGIQFQAVVCLFHESVILKEGITTPRFTPLTAEILNRAVARTSTYVVAAVTDRLQTYVWERFGIRLPVFANPIPGMGDASVHTLDTSEAGPCPQTPANVVFLGQARPEKGGTIISEVVTQVQKDPDWMKDIRFLVRAGTEGAETTGSRVEILSTNMDENAYWEVLKKADILVIPYLSPAFKYRTSGIIVDAMYAGKPCIVMDDTWLSDVVSRYYFGLPVRYYSPHSISAAVNTILNNYQFFSENAQMAFGRYKQDHSWSALANLLDRFD